MPNLKYTTGAAKEHWRATKIIIYALPPDPTNEQAVLARAEVWEAVAMTRADGRVRHVEDVPGFLQVEIRASDMDDTLPLVNPDTDQDIGNTTVQAAYLHVLALVRRAQRARDAAEAAPQPE